VATLKNATLLAALALGSFTCLGSLLYVSDANAPLKGSNHWQMLDAQESRYGDVQRQISGLLKLPEAQINGSIFKAGEKKRARELALIYRQQGKQEKAAEIYRLLWLSADKGFNTEDGLALAATYTDMGGFPSAILSYQKILAYDQTSADIDPRSRNALVARDLNNLGQCYYTVACATARGDTRKKYLHWAKEQFIAAAKLTSAERESALINQNLAGVDTELEN
jgi:tetratricopeptide (TPR) repeat protein